MLVRTDGRDPPPVPAPVRAALGVREARPLRGGGSPAGLWLTETRSGDRFVVKVQRGRDGTVDGHDLATFRLKPRQIRAVHRRLPGLSPGYVRVVGDWSGPGWAAYAMPYHPGRPVTAALDQADADLPAFFGRLDGIFRVLTEQGYTADRRPAPADHFRAGHLDRLRRRLPLLRRCLEPALFTGDRVVVNDRPCRSLPRLLDALAADDRLPAALQPGRLSFPVHGDLNLGNLLTVAGGFLVLDPRGTLQSWDPVYDLAKSLFSLTVFEQALASGFTVRRGGPGAAPSYEVALRGGHHSYPAAAVQFLPFLERLPFAAELDRDDPGWRRRLLVTHAVHCLAEAACRLSDRKPRAYGEVRGWAACRLLATGLYLVGLVLLDELLAASDVPAERHLGWFGAELMRMPQRRGSGGRAGAARHLNAT